MTDTGHHNQIEMHGLEFVQSSERHGKPLDLLWIYVASSIGVFGISYGAFLPIFGLNFHQGLVIGFLGVAISSIFCGIVSLAGKRGNAPTMVLSRAVFGVRGNSVPNALSWVMSVGWETIQIVIASLATATVLGRLGLPTGTTTQLAALAGIVAVVVVIGIFGYDLLVRSMKILTPLSIASTLVYLVIVAGRVDFHAIAHMHAGTTQGMVGAFLLMLAGSGVTLCRVSADYSRYLPRTASSAGTVAWPIVGTTAPLVVLIAFGLALAGSDPALGRAVANDPIGALTTLLPLWYLVPFALIVLVTTIMACSIDIYSASLALLAIGIKVERHHGIVLVAIVTTAASLYTLLSGTGFFVQFQGILITLGMPVAAWAGMMSADIILRKADYDDADLRLKYGRYGDWRWDSLLTLLGSSVVGWGLVTNDAAGWLGWQGYLLGPLGGRTGAWANANLGVVAAIVLGFAGYMLVGRPRVRAQEAL